MPLIDDLIFVKQSFDIFDVEICKQHPGTAPGRNQSGFAGLALSDLLWFLVVGGFKLLVLLDIVNHSSIHLFNSLDGFLLSMIRDIFGHRLLGDDFVLFVLSVELHLKVVFVGVDLVGQFGLLDDVPHELEVVEEEEELPDQPEEHHDEGHDGEPQHHFTVVPLELSAGADLVGEDHDGDFKSNVGKLDEDVDPVRNPRFGRLIEQVEGQHQEVCAHYGHHLRLDLTDGQKDAEQQLADVSQGHLEGNMTVFPHNELVLLSNLARVFPILQREVDHPDGQHEAQGQAKKTGNEIGHIPPSACLQVSQLPQAEEHEGDVAEPETLVDRSETDSPLEYSFRESPESVPLVDALVFEESDQDCPPTVEEQDEEVVSAGDEEGGVSDCQDVGVGSGGGDVVVWDSAGEGVGQELEVEVLQVEEEVAELVGQVHVHEVMEIHHLEDLGSQQQSVRPFEQQDNHDHERNPAHNP